MLVYTRRQIMDSHAIIIHVLAEILLCSTTITTITTTTTTITTTKQKNQTVKPPAGAGY